MANPRPITFLRLRLRGRVRRRLPGGDRADRAGGDRDRPHPRDRARQDVRQGAVVLANALPFCPPGVHLAVVDPGVGSARRAVAVRARARGAFLVGPDNGLLSRASTGSAAPPRRSTSPRSPFRLEPVSATFHGRDLFAPVAAHLALGAPPRGGGRADRPCLARSLDLPRPEIGRTADRRPRDPRGRLRQRHPRPRRLDARRRTAAARATRIDVRAPDGRFEAVWARTFADADPGRRPALRGLLGRAGAGGQRRQRRRRCSTSAPDARSTLRPLT